MIRSILLVAIVLLGLGCSGGAGDGPARVQLSVFAAASLRAGLAEVEQAYEDSHAADIVVSTDSSAALATQIEQGAPADVFLSADLANAERLVEGGSAPGPVVAFAGNVLTVIVPADHAAGISSPVDLARPGVRVIAAGEEVPITGYAGELIANLAALPAYPPDFATAYERNVVSREDSVAAVVTKIELGEGDAAIVYATDAAGPDGIAQIQVPDAANVRATYGGVVLARSGAPDGQANAARAFLDWLAGPEGSSVLSRFGFLPPVP